MSEICRRCGECCKYIAIGIGDIELMPAEVKHWALTRGCKIEGHFLVIPSVCPHLHVDEVTCEAECDLHGTDKKPLVCRTYPLPGVWLPEGCGFGE